MVDGILYIKHALYVVEHQIVAICREISVDSIFRKFVRHQWQENTKNIGYHHVQRYQSYRSGFYLNLWIGDEVISYSNKVRGKNPLTLVPAKQNEATSRPSPYTALISFG